MEKLDRGGLEPVETLIRSLAAAPDRAERAFSGVTAEDAWRRPSPEEWSLAEVLVHIRAADAILAPRILQVVVRPGVSLLSFDERAWGDVLARSQPSIPAQLRSFRARREELVEVLGALEGTEWDHEGEQEGYGRRSVRSYVEGILTHEAEHLGQLELTSEALR